MLTHAVIDALLGAAGLGDIGEHFPDTDERWRDADSIELLRAVVQKLADAGYSPPTSTQRLPARSRSSARTATRCARAWPRRRGLEASAVNVKFTTGERMGFVGRGEGIAALAIATVS